MSFTYSGNPALSTLDAARFLILDTDAQCPIMSDEELQYLIDTYGFGTPIYEYMVFMQCATKFAQQIKRSLGPESEDPTSRMKFYQQRADELKKKLNAAGLSVPTYQYGKLFRKGQFDNPPSEVGADYAQ